VHCAAKTRGAGVAQIVESNIALVSQMIELFRAKPVQRFFFLSSVLVYGKTQAKVLSEATDPACLEPYACSKLIAEELLRNAGFPVTVLRIPAVLESTKQTNFISRTLHQLKRNETIKLFNENQLFNHFIAPSEICRFITTSKQIDASFDVVNVASPASMTLGEVIDFLRELTRSKSVIENIEVDQKLSVIDTGRAKERYGFESKDAKQILQAWSENVGF